MSELVLVLVPALVLARELVPDWATVPGSALVLAPVTVLGSASDLVPAADLGSAQARELVLELAQELPAHLDYRVQLAKAFQSRLAHLWAQLC